MTPSCLTDDELLRHYSELFRQHPATAELAERMNGGGKAAELQRDLEIAQHDVIVLEGENHELRDQVENLAMILEDFLDDTSAANAKAARKVLDSLGLK